MDKATDLFLAASSMRLSSCMMVEEYRIETDVSPSQIVSGLKEKGRYDDFVRPHIERSWNVHAILIDSCLPTSTLIPFLSDYSYLQEVHVAK